MVVDLASTETLELLYRAIKASKTSDPAGSVNPVKACVLLYHIGKTWICYIKNKTEKWQHYKQEYDENTLISASITKK